MFDPVSSSLIATVKLSVSGGASRRFLSYLIMTGAIPPSPSTTTQNARADPIVTDEDDAVNNRKKLSIICRISTFNIGSYSSFHV